MTDTRCRSENFAQYRAFLRDLGGDNGAAMTRLRRNLHRAVREELTPRQLEMVQLYYIRGLTMSQTAELLGVNVSTVSRTLRRVRTRLQRCLRYGAGTLLEKR